MVPPARSIFVSQEEVLLAQYLVGRTIETYEPLVDPQILGGQRITQYRVQALAPDCLYGVILNYVYYENSQTMREGGLVLSFDDFCTNIREKIFQIVPEQLQSLRKAE